MTVREVCAISAFSPVAVYLVGLLVSPKLRMYERRRELVFKLYLLAMVSAFAACIIINF